jgi:hypothetical protein
MSTYLSTHLSPNPRLLYLITLVSLFFTTPAFLICHSWLFFMSPQLLFSPPRLLYLSTPGESRGPETSFHYVTPTKAGVYPLALEAAI